MIIDWDSMPDLLVAAGYILPWAVLGGAAIVELIKQVVKVNLPAEASTTISYLFASGLTGYALIAQGHTVLLAVLAALIVGFGPKYAYDRYMTTVNNYKVAKADAKWEEE